MWVTLGLERVDAPPSWIYFFLVLPLPLRPVFHPFFIFFPLHSTLLHLLALLPGAVYWPYAPPLTFYCFNSRTAPDALCVHSQFLLGCFYNKIKAHRCPINPIGAPCLPREMIPANILKREIINGKEEMTRGRTVNKQLALAPTQKLIKRNSDKLLSTFWNDLA